MIKKFLFRLSKKFFFRHKYVLNLNFQPHREQKRVLISYITKQLEIDFDNEYVGHPNVLEVNLICSAFIERNYKIDICYCNDNYFIEEYRDRTYDLIFGFGEAFRYFSKSNPKAKKVLYSTENAPQIAYEKELERVENYYERTNKKIQTERAFTYYLNEDFGLADEAIILQNEYNAKNFKNLISIDKTTLLKTTGLKNEAYVPNRNVKECRSDFVWLGSRGVIHKGLDLLVEVFNESPNLKLHILGLNKKERHLLPDFIHNNIIDHGFICVNSSKFVDLMNKVSFIVLPSCSEAMSTGVLTGMRHGLIPVVTRETGINLDNYGFYIESVIISDLRGQLNEISELPVEELVKQHDDVINDANDNYTLNKFNHNFVEILNNLAL